MSSPIISVENLSKSYLVGHQSAGKERYTALRDVMGRHAKNLGRKAFDMLRGKQIVQGDEVKEFWALKDVSFEVQPGEVVGIIGRNGAGKSTLLKILSRITEPTSGKVTLRGRVASLLEVGTGFHPELTGRENVFLNGAILGMQRSEIKKKFDEIIAFAGVEKFLDTPVKKYSSGMHVRLAFAVAAHLDPEILIVDEVLAVGDFEFQRKCLGKLKTLSSQGERTVIFVSHDAAALEALCRRGILISKGEIVSDGEMRDQLARFRKRSAPSESEIGIQVLPGILLAQFSASEPVISTGNALSITAVFESSTSARFDELCLLGYSPLGARVFIVDAREQLRRSGFPTVRNFEVRFEIDQLPLVEGEYSVGLWVRAGENSGEYLDITRFTVVPTPRQSMVAPYAANYRGLLDVSSSIQLKLS